MGQDFSGELYCILFQGNGAFLHTRYSENKEVPAIVRRHDYCPTQSGCGTLILPHL